MNELGIIGVVSLMAYFFIFVFAPKGEIPAIDVFRLVLLCFSMCFLVAGLLTAL